MPLNAVPFTSQPEPLTMRRSIGRFVSGVAVLTAGGDRGAAGMTINSLTSISLEPPVLMISLNFGTRTGEVIEKSNQFAISILGASQEVVARQFASRGGERFEVGNFDLTPNGIPVIGDSLAQFECTVLKKIDVGDHRVFFGQVDHCRDRDGVGLSFNSGRFGEFKDHGHEPFPWLA